MNAAHAAKVHAAFGMVKALAEAIRSLGEVPSGDLYAQVMGKLDLETYNGCMASLKNAQLVEEDASHMLRWIGPKEDAREEPVVAQP